MALLSDEDVRRGLPDGWSYEDGAIAKQYEFDGFPTAVAFVNLLADAAEDANHHPDLDIRYNKVRVVLSTHSEGGVTGKDLDLAAAAETLARAATEAETG